MATVLAHQTIILNESTVTSAVKFCLSNLLKTVEEAFPSGSSSFTKFLSTCSPSLSCKTDLLHLLQTLYLSLLFSLFRLQAQTFTLFLQSMGGGRRQQDPHITGPSTVNFVPLPHPPKYKNNNYAFSLTKIFLQ